MTRLYVSRRNISANRKDGGNRPVVSVLRDGLLTLCHEAQVVDEDGRVVARLVYDRETVKAVQVWVETVLHVECIDQGERPVDVWHYRSPHDQQIACGNQGPNESASDQLLRINCAPCLRAINELLRSIEENDHG